MLKPVALSTNGVGGDVARKRKSAAALFVVFVVVFLTEEVVLLKVGFDLIETELFEGLGLGVDGRETDFRRQESAVVDRCERVERQRYSTVEVCFGVVVLLEVVL